MTLFMFLFVFLFSSIAVATFLFSRLHRRNVPPGSFSFPFAGETLQLIAAYKSSNPEPFIDDRVKRFGSVFTTHVFGEPTVFSADQETNRFILQNEGRLFDSSYPSSIETLLGKHSLVLMKGAAHRKMHSLTMKFASSAIIKDHLLVDIDRLIRLNLKRWPDRVLLLEESKKITFELAVKQLLSLDPCQWTERLREHYMLVIDGFFALPYISAVYRRAIKARKRVAASLIVEVKRRREERERGGAVGEECRKEDMLEALLAAGGDDGISSDEEIVDFLLALLVAGYETTSVIMTLSVKFLTESPAALAQLRHEHDEIKKRKNGTEALEWCDYKSMPFTQCVINETLRVANIISGVFRRVMEDVQIKGYTIPKGWKVFASFRAVHLDQDNFNEARTFNPWRWQNNKSGVSSPGANIFTPFGGGQRLCPGYELARVELSVFLHHLLTCFSWEPAEQDRLVFFPTTRTEKKYPITLRRRQRTEEVSM